MNPDEKRTAAPSTFAPTYSRDSLPEAEFWREYRKRVTTKALRIEGGFNVQTTEGMLYCEDGWLAIDSRGYPYPIADDEFKRIYEVVETAQDDGVCSHCGGSGCKACDART